MWLILLAAVAPMIALAISIYKWKKGKRPAPVTNFTVEIEE